MEQTRILVAIVLSFIILLLWQVYFVKKTPQKQEVAETNVTQKVQTNEKAPETTLAPKETPATENATEEVEEQKLPEIITIDTPLYVVRINEKGAAFQSFKLKDYKETVEKDSPLKELINPENKEGTLLSGFEDQSVPGMKEAVYTCQAETKDLEVLKESKKVTFQWRSKRGVIIEKSYVFSPDTYLIGVDVTVKNQSASAIRDQLTLSMIDIVEKTSSRYGFSGPSVMVDNKLEKIKPKKLSDQNSFNGNISWAAYQEQYFMSTIIPSKPENTSVKFLLEGDDTFIESRVLMPVSTIAPDSSAAYNYNVYFGPKSISILKKMGHQLEKVTNFGFFDFIARPCLWIMNLIYRFIPNYGVAIILLTLIIKGILWPLGNKSYKSMSQMKKMQPLMAEIRERYKDDKQKMNMEMMSLYKTYKVNPLGGCLPMLVQFPVLFGLYEMLYQAVELRHKPFIGWINDLSAPERLGHFGFHIPFMHAPYGIPVLTILMGVTMFVQQKMQPPMGDPSQAKMMMFMPLFFIVICVNLSSGLVLYWFVSNVISIIQQYYVTKKTT